MDWQLPLVALAVTGAVGYLGRKTWRTWSGSKCGGGCCSEKQASASAREAPVPLITAEQLTARARQQRPSR